LASNITRDGIEPLKKKKKTEEEGGKKEERQFLREKAGKHVE